MSKDTQKQDDNSIPERSYDHLKDHQFKPGQSGNPGGRPKGSGSLMVELRRRLTDGEAGERIIDSLIQRAFLEAEKGDFRFWQEIMHIMDGKVPDKIIQSTGVEGWEIEYEAEDEVEKETDSSPGTVQVPDK